MLAYTNLELTLRLCCLFFFIDTAVSGIFEGTGVSSATVTECIKFLRQLAGEKTKEDKTKIGGKNFVVEVDKTKLEIRKYYRGRCVVEVWFIGEYKNR